MAALERTVGTAGAIGSDDLVAPPAGDVTELIAHPAVGVANAEVAVHELEALAEAVDEPLIEVLQRRHLAPGPIQHHDDDGEGREEVEEEECDVHGHVSARARCRIEERRHHAVHAPQGERHGKEPGAAIPRRLGPSRPELQAREDQGAPRGETGRAPRGGARVGHVAEARGDQSAGQSDQHIATPNPIVEAEDEASCENEEHHVAEEHGVDERDEDLGAGNEIASQVQALRQAHETPGHEQVAEEPHAVGRVQIAEDQELKRQREA